MGITAIKLRKYMDCCCSFNPWDLFFIPNKNLWI